MTIFLTATLDQTKIIETIDNTTLVIHNVFKRIWPSTARETLIIDHMRPITSLHGATESSPNSDGARFAGPGWIVVSFSTDHSSVPVSQRLFQKIYLKKKI